MGALSAFAIVALAIVGSVAVLVVVRTALRGRSRRPPGESEYRQLAEAGLEGTLVVGREGVLYANQAASRILGRSRAELMALDLPGMLAMIAPADRDATLARIERRLEGEALPTALRQNVIRGDRTVLAVQTHSDAITFHGRWASLTTFSDITRAVAGEAALRESEARYRAMVKASPDLLFRVDRQGKFVDFHASEAAVLAADRDAITGRTLEDVLPVDVARRAREYVDRSLSEGATCSMEYQLETAGRVRDYEARFAPSGEDEVLIVVRDISQASGAAEAVRRSERRFRRMVERGWDLIMVIDADGIITYASPSVTRILGHSPSNCIGRPFSDLVDPRDLPVGSASFAGALQAADAPERVETRALHADGSSRWLEVVATNLLDDPAVSGIVAIARDVTERRAVFDALSASEARYRVVSDAANEMILAVDEHGRITYANRAVERVLGWASDELIGQPLVVLMPESHRQRHLDGFARYLRSGQRHIPWEDVEMPVVARDGRTVDVEISLGEYISDGRRLFLGVARDVTERRRTDRERAQLARAIEQLAEVVVITDDEGMIEYVNPAFERTTGYTRAEVLGFSPRLLKSGQQDAEFYRDLWDTLGRGETWLGHFVNRRKDGTSYHQESVISPVRDVDGRTVNYVHVGRDVTRERELGEQLRRSQKLEAVGSFTSGVAHDLNNVLSVVLANADLLVEGLEDDQEDLQVSAADIHVAASRAAKMIKQLLGFGRQATLDLHPLRLHGVVQELASMISRLLPETIDVQLHTAPDLSPVLADSGSVEQMVLNLVTNARDAMPDGGTLEISLGTGDRDEAELSGHPGAEAGPYVWLAVADTGVGMDEETLAHAFEPFFTTKGPGMGTGLGLAVTYGLMEQHGGFVELWSEPGSGSRVKLYFPGLGGEIAEDAPEEADGRLPSGAGQTILVVEDEAPLRRTAQRVLERYGYRVLVADNGHSAMELVRQHRTDLALIISDVVMPRMGGIQLLAALQAEAIEVPVVLTSGYDGSPQEQAERVRRGNAFLLKPWSIQSLLVTVHDTLTLG